MNPKLPQALAPIALAIMSNLIINLWDITGDEEDAPPLTMTLSDYPDAISFVDVAPTDGLVEDGLGDAFNAHMVDIISESSVRAARGSSASKKCQMASKKK